MAENDEDFAQLLDMGFEASAIREALKEGGCFEAALPRLLNPSGAAVAEPNASPSTAVPSAPPMPESNAPRVRQAAPASAPMPAPALAKDSSLPEVAWLAREALELEGRAAEIDRRGVSAEAALQHRRAASKLAEAAALCPDGHPDKTVLEGHSRDVATRAVYLQSLGGMPATISLEDHVGDVALTLDLNAAAPPPEKDVAALVAGAGLSGSTAPLTDDGFQLVAALRSEPELRAFCLRILEADLRRVKPGEENEFAFMRFCNDFDCKSFEQLRDELRAAPWAEVNLDPKQDRLELGVRLEGEAKDFEARGRRDEAVQAYERALVVFQLVYKYDQRSKNPKIKDMIGKRMAELQARAEALKRAAT